MTAPPKPPLSEEFAPTGPKLSRFPIRPAPPIVPRLFPDEARFALRLAFLAGGTELAAWAYLARAHTPWAALFGAVRLLRPLWSKAGTVLPRPLVAFALLFLALAAQGAALFLPILAVGLLAVLPALGDLAASCITDSVTVERRAAALSWLEMGQGAGVLLGLVIGTCAPRLVPLAAAVALLAAGAGVLDLHDRGTPRSTWPLSSYLEVLRAPLPRRLATLALLGGLFSGAALRAAPPLWSLAALFAALVLIARLEGRARNAVVVPTLLAGLAALALAGSLWEPPLAAALALVCLGSLATALPASVARGAAELQRALAGSLVWSALALGAGAGAALAAAAW